ncbi:hypothetical protein HBJ00_14165 [Aeromonas veronii]|nr:hypothetical protein [Aeromonas veronii]
MPALIPELIAMASDPTIKTADLLRKAWVAARQLKQPEWAAWINYELQGYPDGVELPPYRLLRGELKVRNPIRGLIPLMSDSPGLIESLSTCRFVKPVGELEVLATAEHGIVRYLFPPNVAAEIMAMQGDMPMRGARRIRKKSYAKVFRASVRAETSRLPVCGSAARRNRRLG